MRPEAAKDGRLAGSPVPVPQRGQKGGLELSGSRYRRCVSAGAADLPLQNFADDVCVDRRPGLLSILGKSQPIGDGCEPDFFDFRVKQLQWRTGQAQGARGELADLASKAGAWHGDHGAKKRSGSWWYPRDEARKLWMLSADLEQDLQSAYPRFWEWLQPQVSRIFQLVVLLLVVCTYSACPLTVSWAKVVGVDESGPVKGRPFKESSVIVVSWLMIAAVGLLLSAAIGGWRDVRQCFDRRAIATFAPAGVGWALADVCEVLAVARIDPAMYGVISQARLLGSAAACRVILGSRQSKVQWGVLAALSLVCMAYCMVPDPHKSRNSYNLVQWRLAQAQLDMKLRFKWVDDEVEDDDGTGSSEQVLGVILALGKVTLSVLSGVYGESCFKLASANGTPPELHVQMTQVSFSSTLAACLGYLAICSMQGDNYWEFFSGPDGYWDYRTLVVAMVYCWREWICNLCVKRFDSLVKNICNAVALVLTYAYTVMGSKEQSFSLLKVMLLLAVVAEVVNYSSARTAAVAARAAASEQIPVAEYRAMHKADAKAEVRPADAKEA